MKKISVVLTSYNCVTYIDRTISSILNQSGRGVHFEIELIVVDDCSTDGTFDHLKCHDLILLSTGENSGGPNRGRNIGMRRASGDYISIVDHDDEWMPNRILGLLPYVDEAPIISSGYTAVNSEAGITYDVKCSSTSSHRFYQRNETFLDKLRKSNSMQNTYLGSLLFSAELKEIEFEEHFGMVDYDWVLRLFHRNESIEVCQTLYYRHIGQRNLSFNETYRRIDYYYSLMFVESYELVHPLEVEISKKKINGSRARYYYWKNEMRKARYYFRKAGFSLVNTAYFITTYFGSRFVRNRFKLMR
jgi:glycosyltransferase involved in cell wall biosynthesis